MDSVLHPQYTPLSCPIKFMHSLKRVWAASWVSGVDGHPGFLPHPLLETEGRGKRVLAGWEVSYVHPAGPQQGLIAAINTSSLAG